MTTNKGERQGLSMRRGCLLVCAYLRVWAHGNIPNPTNEDSTGLVEAMPLPLIDLKKSTAQAATTSREQPLIGGEGHQAGSHCSNLVTFRFQALKIAKVSISISVKGGYGIAYIWKQIERSDDCCGVFIIETCRRNRSSSTGGKPLAKAQGTEHLGHELDRLCRGPESQGLVAWNRKGSSAFIYGNGIHPGGTFGGVFHALPKRQSVSEGFCRAAHEKAGRLTENLGTEITLGYPKNRLIQCGPLGSYASLSVLYVGNHCLFHAHSLCKLLPRKPLFFALRFNEFSDVHTYSINP